jgi:hypothetical protein
METASRFIMAMAKGHTRPFATYNAHSGPPFKHGFELLTKQ